MHEGGLDGNPKLLERYHSRMMPRTRPVHGQGSDASAFRRYRTVQERVTVVDLGHLASFKSPICMA